MKGCRKRRLKARAGTSLVEMVVSMLVFGIMMNMAVGVLSPASRLFLRMERLQRAQVILDNTVLELYGIAENATRYVKLYDTEAVSGRTGTNEGCVLEFVSKEDYVALVSAGGCPDTRILMEGVEIETAKAIGEGQLLTRYYVNDSPASGAYEYKYEDAAGNIARAVIGVFTEGYYMGNYLEVRFYQPDGSADGDTITSIRADVSLYAKDKDGNKGELIVQEKDIVLNFRYAVVRNDKVTARAEP